MFKVDADTFARHFNAARDTNPIVAASTSEFSDDGSTQFFADDADGYGRITGGYGIRADGELVFVFSTRKGRGDAIVAHAVTQSALSLDCFDSGPLVALYRRHGFEVERIEANWTPGYPDVVYMRQA